VASDEGGDDRLAALERQIAYLYAHFGLDPAAANQVELPVPARIAALVSDGKKVTAIREYRRVFDASLADATRAIDRLDG
jgi:ribosomal protein L7/L12